MSKVVLIVRNSQGCVSSVEPLLHAAFLQIISLLLKAPTKKFLHMYFMKGK